MDTTTESTTYTKYPTFDGEKEAWPFYKTKMESSLARADLGKILTEVYGNHMGAIFMTENKSSSSQTRHMDTRYWYVHQLQEEHGLIKVNFVRTKDNVSDIGTKNVDTETYKRHEGKLIVSKEDV